MLNGGTRVYRTHVFEYIMYTHWHIDFSWQWYHAGSDGSQDSVTFVFISCVLRGLEWESRSPSHSAYVCGTLRICMQHIRSLWYEWWKFVKRHLLLRSMVDFMVKSTEIWAATTAPCRHETLILMCVRGCYVLVVKGSPSRNDVWSKSKGIL